MMEVDKNLCIGCSLCVKDCIVNDIELVDGKAKIKNVSCFKCGHCIAICPKNAVSTDDYNMEEVLNFDKDSFTIDADNLLNFIKFRRSVRYFKKQDIEIEKINKIIEAGRFTQTSTNSQNVSYVVVKDSIEKLKEMAFESLYNLGTNLLENLNAETKPFERYARMWINMYNAYKSNPNGRDGLFFNAPVVILIISDSPVNASLASSNMELITNALGLGTFFSGFFIRAAQGNKEIMDFLGLAENQQIINCMVVGYPSVRYQRTTPRKESVVSWK